MQHEIYPYHKRPLSKEIADLSAKIETIDMANTLKAGQILYDTEERQIGRVVSVSKSVDRKNWTVEVSLRCEMDEGKAVPGKEIRLQTEELIFTANVSSAWPAENFDLQGDEANE